MNQKAKKAVALFLLVIVISIGVWQFQRNLPQNRVGCEVWSENSPYGQATQFKVNWYQNNDIILNEADLIDCWLYELDAVKVTAPDKRDYYLEKDFNINSYSGEITQRWVLYQAEGLALPPTGDYIFRFVKNGEILLTKTVHYVQSFIDYPKDVQFTRDGMDLLVSWTPPEGVDKKMWYKVIVSNDWNDEDTPNLFISQEFHWNSTIVRMKNVPLQEGGNYSLNVALFFSSGFSYSIYHNFFWSAS